MKPLQILIPMGGLGERFRKEGYTTPKPLIKVGGKEMFLRAIESFNAYPGTKEYTLIIRSDADLEYGLKDKIKKILPDANVVILKNNTRGAAETSLLAKKFINNDNPLVIMDCDFEFKSHEYFTKISDIINNKKYDALVLSFSSQDPRYSYAVAKGENVTDIAEKRVISQNALAGAYFFREGKIFVENAEKLLQETLNENMKEYYISYVYKKIIDSYRSVTISKIDTFNSFGTPEELNNYNSARTIKAFMFDLDGTLVETHSANFEAYKKAIGDFGINITHDDFKKTIGFQAQTFLPLLAPGLSADDYKVIADNKSKYYKEFAYLTKLNTWLLKLLHSFKPSHKMVLVTTAKRKNAEIILNHHGILNLFDEIITSDDVSNSKPSPECYKLALKRTGLRPGEVIAFEDSRPGAEAAERAGIAVIMVSDFNL